MCWKIRTFCAEDRNSDKKSFHFVYLDIRVVQNSIFLRLLQLVLRPEKLSRGEKVSVPKFQPDSTFRRHRNFLGSRQLFGYEDKDSKWI